MASRVRDLNWSRTPLGPIAEWSDALLTSVNMVLSAPIPMQLFWGPELVIIYNDGLMPILTDKHPEALGRSAREAWAEAWPTIGPQMEEVLRHGKPVYFSNLLVPIHRHGVLQDAYWDYSYSPVYGPYGKVEGVLDVVRDVTAAVLAEKTKRESDKRLDLAMEAAVRSEEQLKVITDALPAFISYLDTSLRYLRVNRTYEEWFHTPAEEIVGKSLEEVLGPEAAKTTGEYLRKALRGQPQHFEYRLRTAERDRVLSVAHIPDLDTQGEPRGVIVQGQDITERKRAEEALIQSEKLAAVGRLAASIAHEINNPLESVTNLLYLASLSDTLADAHGFIETAERELRRVSVISNQTLRFYKQTTAPRAVTCEDLVESVLSIHQGKLLNSRVQIEMRMRAKEPIRCFDGEIRQVLNNLIGNAVDAMHPGGGRLLLRSRETCNWQTAQKGIMLTIADSGSGMSQQVLGKVFEAFYSTKGIGGTGLGLWVSKEIVDRHHGSLRARSTQETGRSGTVFSLFLPFDAANR